jgi:hypothetical protein
MGRDGMEMERFTGPGVAGADGEASGGWMAPVPPPIGGRKGRKLGAAGFSVSEPSALATGAAVCGGVTGFVAGGRGRIGALRAGNGGRASSLNVVRIGGEKGCRGPFSASLTGRGVKTAVLAGSTDRTASGALAISTAAGAASAFATSGASDFALVSATASSVTVGETCSRRTSRASETAGSSAVCSCSS